MIYSSEGRFCKKLTASIELLKSGCTSKSDLVTNMVEWLKELYKNEYDDQTQLWNTFTTDFTTGLLKGFQKISTFSDLDVTDIGKEFKEAHSQYEGTFPDSCMTFATCARAKISSAVKKKSTTCNLL